MPPITKIETGRVIEAPRSAIQGRASQIEKAAQATPKKTAPQNLRSSLR